MRILFVTNRYPTAERPGESPNIAQQCAALQRLGYHVDVLYVDSQGSRRAYLDAMARVWWECHVRRAYDLVHAHYGFSGFVARAQWRVPVVVTYRGSDVLTLREWPSSRFLAHYVDRCIVMTDEMRELLGRADADVIPYGIDLTIFRPLPQAEARAALDLPLDAPLLLFPYDPGRAVKRFDLVEAAAELARAAHPALQVITVCDKTPEELALYMNACDVMVLASDSEGAPGAVREALACNLPIVSVDVGDVAELIGPIDGCSIVERDAAAIAAQLNVVLAERRRVDGVARVKHLDVARSAAAIARIYQELCNDCMSHGRQAV